MKHTVRLAEVRTKDGDVLALLNHDQDFEITINDEELMSTRRNYSELMLGDLGVEAMKGRLDGTVLIGGLGLGYTLASVLPELGDNAKVEVAELLPEIVQWNEEYLQEVNGTCLSDPRVLVRVGNVVPLIRNAKPAQYDVMLLDVDNGPEALVSPENQWLYSDAGLRILQRVLTRKGRVVFWSADAFPAFEKRLKRSGFRVRAVPAKTYPNAKRFSYMLYVADKKN